MVLGFGFEFGFVALLGVGLKFGSEFWFWASVLHLVIHSYICLVQATHIYV